MRQGIIDLPKAHPPLHGQQPPSKPAASTAFATTTTTAAHLPAHFDPPTKPAFGFGGQAPFAASTPAKPVPKPFQPVSAGFGSSAASIGFGSSAASTGFGSTSTAPAAKPAQPVSAPTTAATTAPTPKPTAEKVRMVSKIVDFNNKLSKVL
jgi:hypothetical protein